MDFLNSQYLTSHDGFVHPFRRAGTFVYSVATSDFGEGTGGMIVVENAPTAIGEGEQHDIFLQWDTATRRFVVRAEDMRKVIKQNDFVVFQFDRTELGQPPCFIVGRHGDDAAFDSRQLTTHEAFSHFFLAPGDYSYRLGRGIYSVSVVDHRQFSIDEHERRAQEPLGIIINRDDVSVKNAKIVTGQTVIWAIENGENVSIIGIEQPKPTMASPTFS